MATRKKAWARSSGAGAAFAGAYRSKTILITGHTGFKGAWLCEWLLGLGARVTGFSLPPPTRPALFEQLALAKRLRHREGDVRDAGALAAVVKRVQPDFIFHLAAQALVRESYRTPSETYATNVMGTVHLLEAARQLDKPCAVVCVTSDKCYENRERDQAYVETDALGGHDPYSSSKAAAEIAIAAWRRSFFEGQGVRLASARSGNVIGGGDWAADRIVPDCIRALQKRRTIAVRHPQATRPWLHVLEPLSGYLWLGARLAQRADSQLCSAFNFGPGPEAKRTVAELVAEILKHWPGRWITSRERQPVHEAGLLQLNTDKAATLLNWSPVWDFAEAVSATVSWYQAAAGGDSAAALRQLTRQQIEEYCRAARRRKASWARG